MTPRQYRAAIKTALDLAEREVAEARKNLNPSQESSWIACMTASKVFSGLVAILMNMEEVESHNGPTEKNIPEL